jgi:hypothetical protein
VGEGEGDGRGVGEGVVPGVGDGVRDGVGDGVSGAGVGEGGGDGDGDRGPVTGAEAPGRALDARPGWFGSGDGNPIGVPVGSGRFGLGESADPGTCEGPATPEGDVTV